MAACATSGDRYSKFYNARDKLAEELGFVPLGVLAVGAETVLPVDRSSPLARPTGYNRARPLRLPTNTGHHPEKLLDDRDDDDLPH